MVYSMKIRQLWEKKSKKKKILFVVSVIIFFILIGILIFIFRDTKLSQTIKDGEMYQLKNGIYISDDVDVIFNDQKDITKVRSDLQEIAYDYVYESDLIKKISYSGIYNQLNVDGSVEFTYDDNKLQKLKLINSGYTSYTEEYLFYYNQKQQLIAITNESNSNGTIGLGKCYLYYDGDYILEECEKNEGQSNYHAQRIYKKQTKKRINFFSEYQFLPFVEYLSFFENHLGSSYLHFFEKNDNLMTPVFLGMLLHEKVIKNNDGKEIVEGKENYLDKNNHVIKTDLKDYGTTYIKYNDNSFIIWENNKLMDSYQKSICTSVKEKNKKVGYQVQEKSLTKEQYKDEISEFSDYQLERELQYMIENWEQVTSEKYQEQFIVAPTIHAIIPTETDQPTLNIEFQVTYSTDNMKYPENKYMDTKLFDYQTNMNVFLNDVNVNSMCNFDTGKCSFSLKNGMNKIEIYAANNYQKSTSETYQVVFQPSKPQITLKNNIVNSMITHDGRVMEGDYLYLSLSQPLDQLQLSLYCDNQLWLDYYSLKSNCSIQSDLTYQCYIPQTADWRYAHTRTHACYIQVQDQFGQNSQAFFQINFQ